MSEQIGSQKRTSNKALVYLHTDTREHGDSPATNTRIASKRTACTRRAMELGLSVVSEFVDIGVPVKPSRTQLLAAMDEFRESDASHLIVDNFGDLCRSRLDQVRLSEFMDSVGVTVVAADGTERKRALIYVFGELPVELSAHLQPQTDECQRYARARDWEIVATYREAMSLDYETFTHPRPSLQALLKRVQRGDIDYLLTCGTINVTRSPERLREICRHLKKHGAQLVKVNKPLTADQLQVIANMPYICSDQRFADRTSQQLLLCHQLSNQAPTEPEVTGGDL